MRSLAIALLATAAGLCTAAADEIEVRSSIDTVTVYPDSATVTRVIRLDLPGGDSSLIARDFPLGLDPASLRVEGEGGGRLTIGSIETRTPRQEPPASTPEIERRIETLKDERSAFEDRIAAAAARKRFAERFGNSVPLGLGDKADARPLADWRAAFQTVAEEIASADAIIREARLKQRDIDRELTRLQAELKTNPPRKQEVRIDVAAEARTAATLRVSYQVRGARWQPLYDARLDTGGRNAKPKLDLVRRAEVVQQTGEDWSNVTLSVSTVRTARRGGAPELSPWIVRFEQPPIARPMTDRPRSSAAQRVLGGSEGDMAAAAPPQLAQEREAVVESGGFQVLFRIPGRISLGADEGTKSFRIASTSLAPDLLVRATPVLDPTGYLEASFKQAEEAPLLPGRVALYRDGTFVGNGRIALTPKEETVQLGFGADDKIKVTRTLVRRDQGSTGILGSGKIDEQEFKITVRNGHDSPIRIALEDRIPVSEIDDITVELLSLTTPPTEQNVRDRRGVLAWSFTAAPGEAREIKLGWRVRWPAEKAIQF